MQIALALRILLIGWFFNVLAVPDYFMFMGIGILPGTALANIAVSEGIISPENDLLESVYYVSPELDVTWLEETLTEAFSKKVNCIFPPDSKNEKLHLLHQMGYSSGKAYKMLGRMSS